MSLGSLCSTQKHQTSDPWWAVPSDSHSPDCLLLSNGEIQGRLVVPWTLPWQRSGSAPGLLPLSRWLLRSAVCWPSFLFVLPSLVGERWSVIFPPSRGSNSPQCSLVEMTVGPSGLPRSLCVNTASPISGTGLWEAAWRGAGANENGGVKM